MAIRKHNRALFFIFAVIVIVLFFVLRKEKKVQEYFDSAVLQDKSVQEQTPDSASSENVTADTSLPINSPDAAISSDEQKNFVQVFNDMTECLEIKSASYSERDPINVETILSQLQSDLGFPKYNSDLWMNWHLRTREGREKRIRLEISSASDEPTTRELRYFILDREGIPQPVPMDDEKSMNPSDEALNQLLREGEVFYKDRSGFYTFANGERLEYVEKNGQLSEIEMVRGESIFKCLDVRARENCRCIK